jgi:hypothetical protein
MVHYEEARDHRNVESMEVARKTIEEYASACCDHCRDIMTKSLLNNECRKTYQEIKALPEFSKCTRCGSVHAIQLNHIGGIETKKKRINNKCEEVPLALSEWKHWTANGGPPAMWAETELVEPLCAMCHPLDEHSNQSKRVDPSTLPDVSKAVDSDAYKKKWNATIKWPKYQFVDAYKVLIGGCENPECPNDGPLQGAPLTKENVVQYGPCYDFDHPKESDKAFDESKGKNGRARGISRMSSDSRIRPEEEWKKEIRDEIRDKGCRMLCKNCHHRKSNEGYVVHFLPRLFELPDDPFA